MARQPQAANGTADNGIHSLATLIQSLRSYLGTTSGINSAEIDVSKLKSLLASYKPTADEWLHYGEPDPSRGYTRLLVDGINGKSNLLFIVWNPGKKSPIHDHANAHCVMKILKGSLQETVYNWPESKDISQGPMSVKKQTIYQEEEVAYISDEIGLHHIANPDQKDVSVSLHLYTPPNAADFGYKIFDYETGKSSHVR